VAVQSASAEAVLASIPHINPRTQASMQEGAEELEPPHPWAVTSTKPIIKRDLTTALFNVLVITLAPWAG
jgi:hypothetical protein